VVSNPKHRNHGRFGLSEHFQVSRRGFHPNASFFVSFHLLLLLERFPKSLTLLVIYIKSTFVDVRFESISTVPKLAITSKRCNSTEKNLMESKMPEVAHTAYEMISGMKPDVRPGIYVFISTEDPALSSSLSSQSISTFMEGEGVSMIIPIELAKKSKLNADHPMRCITLNVYSSLEGVGLTAAVSSALGDNSIPCNVVAAFQNDDVFVPAEMCDRAMEVLTSLQKQAAKHP